jgi:hypothetical protein
MEPDVAAGLNGNTPPPSSRDALASAFEGLEKDETHGDTQGAGDTPVQQTGQEAGQTAPAGDTPGAVKDTGLGIAPAKEPQQTKPAASLTDTPSQTPRVAKPPASWKPAAREHFAALPPAVQNEVLRRERETQVALQDSAQARQVIQRFGETIGPYQQVIALEGGDPMKAFGDYLKTASVLRMGTPVEKAHAVAQAIHTFGVDVTMLDGALAAVLGGKPLPQPQGQQQQAYHDPRVDQLLQQMQDKEYAQQERMESELSSEIAEFAAKPEFEFFEDLREDISAILRVGVERGRVVSLADAYHTAAQLNPDIAKVIAQRAAAKAAAAGKKDLLSRRVAASSVTVGAPSQTGSTGITNEKGPSIREAIENAIEAQAV